MNCPLCNNELEGTPEAGSWTICLECGDVVVCTSPGYDCEQTVDLLPVAEKSPDECSICRGRRGCDEES